MWQELPSICANMYNIYDSLLFQIPRFPRSGTARFLRSRARARVTSRIAICAILPCLVRYAIHTLTRIHIDIHTYPRACLKIDKTSRGDSQTRSHATHVSVCHHPLSSTSLRNDTRRARATPVRPGTPNNIVIKFLAPPRGHRLAIGLVN